MRKPQVISGEGAHPLHPSPRSAPEMKHLEVHQKYSATRRIFNSLLSVSPGDETLSLMLDILHKNSRQAMGRAQ